MAYCRKCGAKLKDDDVFCFMCGETIDKQANMISGSNLISAPVSKEESIALAERLKDDYASVEKLLKEINENEMVLSRPVVYNDRRHTAFRFFWPFLIFAYLALNVVYVVGAFICAANDDQGGLVLVVFLGLAAAAGVLIYGGSYAGKKRDRLNKELSDDEYMKRKRFKELVERTNELKIKYNNRISEFSEYHQLVPVNFRTRQHMERVIVLLQTNRAADFSEALKLLED